MMPAPPEETPERSHPFSWTPALQGPQPGIAASRAGRNTSLCSHAAQVVHRHLSRGCRPPGPELPALGPVQSVGPVRQARATWLC